MVIDINSIVINNVEMAQYLVEAKFGYHKLWSEDSGRNLAGTQVGTLTGVYPKLTLQFRKLTKTELETLAPILDSATQTTTYYDPYKKALNTIETYSNDWEVINKGLLSKGHKNEAFSWAVISRRKRV